MAETSAPDIAIVLQHPCWGGVERVYLNLARHWAHAGYSVDVVFSCAEGPLAADFRACARVVDLGNVLMKLHRRERYAVLDYPKVKRYIETVKPRSVLAAKSTSNYCVARAKKELDYPGNVVVSHHIDVAAGMGNLSRTQRAVAGWLESYYPHADSAVGVCQSVSDGLLGMGLPPGKVHTIYNPAATDELFRLADEPPVHKWLSPKSANVILGAGRLTAQKDFATLVRAFGMVLDSRPDCRLVIVGEGPDRSSLESLVRGLGLTERVDLPGYASNPYSYMKNADLYVMSSSYEGFGMTLVEALALGTPVVSTDCPSGPAEVLCEGKYGALVPVGDSRALAVAMVDALTNPRTTAEQVSWAKKTFSVESAGDSYLTLLLGDRPEPARPATGNAHA
jgi:glycosyltransferase involved in cell wall biosynthesis